VLVFGTAAKKKFQRIPVGYFFIKKEENRRHACRKNQSGGRIQIPNTIFQSESSFVQRRKSKGKKSAEKHIESSPGTERPTQRGGKECHEKKNKKGDPTKRKKR